MGSFDSWRRAFGAIKDSTTVGLAKVTSDFKNLDIAIVKATNHEECPPKDIHVRSIVAATSFVVPRADVGYCIHTLSRRLTKTKDWIVAVKTLMVLHRILREGDNSFREELLIYSRKRKIFHIAEFRDDTSQLAWDCSSWIRMYAAFLEERIECFRSLGFDIETERLTTTPGAGKGYSRTRLMNVDELLDQLPAMQQLLHRLIVCQPEGAAYNNCLIQHALALILKESMKIYAMINDGIIKLVESFFNLPKDDAVNALNIYKKAGKQAEQLGEFYNLGRNFRVLMNIQFPTLTQPPSSFLATMEEYVKVAPSNVSISLNKLEYQDVVEEQSSQDIEEVESNEVVQDQESEFKPPQNSEEEEALPLITIDDDDCQDLNETTTKATELENIIASQPPLAIVQDGATSSGRIESDKTSSWELSIVTSPSNTSNANAISKDKPSCGFDKMFLYSLYEDDMAKKQMQNEYGMQHNLFHRCNPPPQQDHLMASGGVTPLTTMQTMMTQQQYMTNQLPYQHQNCQNQYQQSYQQQQNMATIYSHQESPNQYLQRQMPGLKLNPIGDNKSYAHGNVGLI